MNIYINYFYLCLIKLLSDIFVLFLDHDEFGNEVIDYNTVEIENGHKANVVRQFFDEHQISIVREGKPFVIDEVIFDEVSLPSRADPDVISGEGHEE